MCQKQKKNVELAFQHRTLHTTIISLISGCARHPQQQQQQQHQQQQPSSKPML